MLSRDHRLPAPDISRVMKTGKRMTGNGFVLVYAGSASPHFACIVSKKTDKRATVRNRIKRILSESIRHLLPTLSAAIDGVFVGNKALMGLTQLEMEARVSRIFHEIHHS